MTTPYGASATEQDLLRYYAVDEPQQFEFPAIHDELRDEGLTVDAERALAQRHDPHPEHDLVLRDLVRGVVPDGDVLLTYDRELADLRPLIKDPPAAPVAPADLPLEFSFDYVAGAADRAVEAVVAVEARYTLPGEEGMYEADIAVATVEDGPHLHHVELKSDGARSIDTAGEKADAVEQVERLSGYAREEGWRVTSEIAVYDGRTERLFRCPYDP